jgi:DNA-directed RNA polymerase specialized sigma24 family protein
VAIDDLNLADPDCSERLREADLQGELEQLLAAASENMKAQELQAFVLHYREGLTVKEITKTLGCENVTGARTLIQNARRKFQRLIKGKGYTSD